MRILRTRVVGYGTDVRPVSRVVLLTCREEKKRHVSFAPQRERGRVAMPTHSHTDVRSRPQILSRGDDWHEAPRFPDHRPDPHGVQFRVLARTLVAAWGPLRTLLSGVSCPGLYTAGDLRTTGLHAAGLHRSAMRSGSAMHTRSAMHARSAMHSGASGMLSDAGIFGMSRPVRAHYLRADVRCTVRFRFGIFCATGGRPRIRHRHAIQHGRFQSLLSGLPGGWRSTASIDRTSTA
jgi:hypothetical protein